MSAANLQRVPVPYLLEVRKGNKLIRSVSLPRGPSAMQYARQGGSDLRHTLGASPIREDTEHRKWTIQLSGKSGTAQRPSYDKKGHVRALNGLEAVREFGLFLKWAQDYVIKHGAHYLTDPDKYRAGLRNVTMVFRALDEDLHLLVIVDRWSWDRDVQTTRMGATWNLSLTGWAVAAAQVPSSVFGSLAARAAQATAVIRKASDVAAQVDTGLTNIRGDLEGLRSPVRALSALLTSATASAQKFNAIARSPVTFAADWYLLANQARAILFELRSQIVTKDALHKIEQSRSDALETLGAAGGGPADIVAAAGRGFSAGDQPPLIPRMVRKFPLVALGAGDTLQSIAREAFGDASAWVRLAAHNGWQDAMHGPDGKPIAVGDVIEVPIDAAAQDSADLYGVDIFVSANGELVLTDDGDLRTVRDAGNLTQALTRRLTTRLGDVATAPDYGLIVAPGDVSSPGVAGYLAAHTREQLLADVRVSDVLSLAVIDQGDTLDIEAEARVVGSRVPLGIVAPVAN